MEFAFVAFAVGVFCGVPAAVLVGHVALDVAGDAAGGVHEGGVAANEPGVEVEVEELGVVVEHFFEMRDEPLGVDGVAGEAAADVVADAACGHAAAGEEDLFLHGGVAGESGGEEEKAGDLGLGEFGCLAPAAVDWVEGIHEGASGGGLDVAGEGFGVFRGGAIRHVFLESAGEVFGVGGEFLAVFLPEFVDVIERGDEAVLGEIGAPEERLAVGGEEDVEGPAAAEFDGLHGGHVDVVDVRAFFAVEFDGDEFFVDDGGDGVAFEAFAFHDVAPVAGAVADAEEDGFVFAFGFFEGFFAPWVPVDWVVLVLEEVGGFFAGEPVGVARLGWGVHGLGRGIVCCWEGVGGAEAEDGGWQEAGGGEFHGVAILEKGRVGNRGMVWWVGRRDGGKFASRYLDALIYGLRDGWVQARWMPDASAEL